MSEGPEHVDVVVVGAGLSGIGAAVRLTQEHPQRSFAILEARATSGGTWDLFRYPGVRSDSDMLTLGYRFRPWRGDRALADGASILAYLRETAREYGVEGAIRYRHRVVAAAWDTASARWTLHVETPTGPARLTCGFLWSCTGYFDYERAHAPRLPGVERFTGPVVHPQHWPEGLDVSGRRVAVIGSGATAVTLVPALARTAAHVTMVQRSPGYVLSLPTRDPVSAGLRRLLPGRAAYSLGRGKNVLLLAGLYRLSRARPDLVRGLLRRQAIRRLPEGYDVDTHFRPRYDPWEQRMCMAPGGDLFRAISAGRVSVVTGTIAHVAEDRIGLEDGGEVRADVLVTATGLTVLPFGGIEFTVDGAGASPAECMSYRGLMLTGLPNLAYTLGYPNASWTLRADLVADFVCRLLSHLDDHGHRAVVPRQDHAVPVVLPRQFTPGYLVRAAHLLPRYGDRDPWRLSLSYLRERRALPRAPLQDGALAFVP